MLTHIPVCDRKQIMNDIFLVIPVLFFSVIFHECAHGYAALRLGDSTAKDMGRITLNPLPHIDLMMTILLPLIVYLSSGGSMIFGGAKPVPVNPLRFRRDIEMRKGMMLTAAAGPVSNFILMLAFIILFKLLLVFTGGYGPSWIGVAAVVIKWGIFINLILMAFNLLPIPPLDGSKVFAYFLPGDYYYRYLGNERFGFFILIILLWLHLLDLWLVPFRFFLNFLFSIFGIH